MASSSTDVAAPPPAGGGLDITAMKTDVYSSCMDIAEEEGLKTVFHQSTIFALGIIPNKDVQVLLQVVQGLLNEKLFKTVQDAEGLGWRVRTEDDAKKFRSLTAEQEMVYGLIDEAGDDGIWTKTIKAKLKIHDTIMRTCLKHLEGRNLIADMKSVEHPTRKMYILSSLRPSERASGGPWYSEGELDMEFVEIVTKVLYTQIKRRSFYTDTAMLRRPAKTISSKGKGMSSAQAKAAREKALGARGGNEDERSARSRLYEATLPMPADYNGYPDLDELTAFLDGSNIAIHTTLGAHDIQQLLDIMCYDDRIEKVIGAGSGIGYRALRKTLRHEHDVTSALTEVPCGRCPVFDLCEEGGPVSPSNCEYFTDWLDI
ncbi:uncharacterized protein BP5553_02497 [Venustampulla echinocandica]|uniref:DNA-directed RNA polymerase III subunit RPC6 n=1 Tax=Venustampulla echinocandica TaxID=2656787 RepID=A0A370U427_9HELO|nr:uncharacterized protein BP5553_02497 [Venustampulla echinocandica]RDL42518.1 hypothetical protein BP5553_02497 [Venustampulla echinocandica]